MDNFLEDIIRIKKDEINGLKAKMPIHHFIKSKRILKGSRDFMDAISSGNSINLIAEIKKKSPSRKRPFFKKIDVAGLAKIYSSNGAKAISVLTDKRFFGGDIMHIPEVKRAVQLPVLRKDFIIDEYQVYESRYFGADAILLIARILGLDQLKSFMHIARKIGMDVVVEVHDEKDLEKAVTANARIIGINNRNLNTFQVDINNTIRLAPKMPNQIIKISESGIKSKEDIALLKKVGIKAVLIGEAFLESGDIGKSVRDIMAGEL